MPKNGKAAGSDEIPVEAIKSDTETAVDILHNLFKKIWERERKSQRSEKKASSSRCQRREN